jgi:hypothetical protein
VHKAIAKRSNPKVDEVNARSGARDITRARARLTVQSQPGEIGSHVDPSVSKPAPLRRSRSRSRSIAHINISYVNICRENNLSTTSTITCLVDQLSSDIDHPFKHVPDTEGSESWDEDTMGDSPVITQKKTKEKGRMERSARESTSALKPSNK